MYVIPILFFAVILILLFRPRRAAVSVQPAAKPVALPAPVPAPVPAPLPALSEREQIGADWLALTIEHFHLGETIAKAKATALALDTGSGGDYSELAKEKRIILEQIRIAGSSHDEIKRHLFEERSRATLEATKWPFSASRLQLQFAQARIAKWPAIAP